MNTSLKSLVRGGLAFLFALLALSSANAASVHYGDLTGSSVMYIDVTETANSPDDGEPLFGRPVVNGNVLDFNPGQFVAWSSAGTTALTDGQLNLTLTSLPGASLDSFSISETGDLTLIGAGTANSRIAYGVGVTSINVLAVDGIALTTPVFLPSASASGGDDLSSHEGILTPWDLSLVYDVDAALTSVGVDFSSGATTLEIAIDNTLAAISERSTNASLSTKDFLIEVRTDPAPLLGDCDGNGVVDAADLDCACGSDSLSFVLAATGLIAGDLDADGQVAFGDFLTLSASFGQDVDRYTEGDIDCNGRVEFSDFLVLSANFGDSSSAVSTPEPEAAALLLIALPVLLSVRKRQLARLDGSEKPRG